MELPRPRVQPAHGARAQKKRTRSRASASIDVARAPRRALRSRGYGAPTIRTSGSGKPLKLLAYAVVYAAALGM